jgi:hypothetical protein
MQVELNYAEKMNPEAMGFGTYHRLPGSEFDDAPYCKLPTDYFQHSLNGDVSRRRVLCTIQRCDGSELLVVDTND